MALSIWLLKPEMDIETALKDKGSLAPYIVSSDSGRQIGDLFVPRMSKNPPRWHGYLAGFAQGLPNLTNATVSAVLFISVEKRLFALTFGNGKSLLAPDCTEDGFGLRVVLNAVPTGKLRTTTTKSLDSFAQHTHRQAVQEGVLGQFGVDLEQDILRAITGTPASESLGFRLTGKDSLGALVDSAVPELPALLGQYLKASRSKKYLKDYPDIEQLKEVVDKSLIEAIETKMLKKIREEDFSNLWLSVPEIVEWEKIFGFRYTEKGKEYPDLHIRDFLQKFSSTAEITVERLKKSRAYAFDGIRLEPFEDWPIFRCLHSEVAHGDFTYVLSDARWFRVDAEFVDTVNSAINPLLSDTSWPAYKHKNEGQYNVHLTDKIGGAALADKKKIYEGGGRSQVELCDVFTKKRQFVHVKLYKGSSGVMSHLFNQGHVSAETFFFEANFRKKARTVLPKSHWPLIPDERPDPQKYEVIYGIVGRARGTKKLSELLPFFSRVTLRRVAQKLDNLGFRRSVVWIPKHVGMKGDS